MGYISVLENILDSVDVTVGGGSASAFSGAMAAGLIGMVARLSLNKDYGLDDRKYIELADELDSLNTSLIKGMQDDACAYLMITKAYKLPKATDEEKVIRKDAIEKAGIDGALVPLNNAGLCKRVYEIGKMLEGKSNKNAVSDLNIGISLARVGVDGCIQNVEANLPLIKKESVLEKFNSEIKNIKLKMEEI